MVCLQVIERAPIATAEELELSNVIPADAGDAAQNSRRRRKIQWRAGLMVLPGEYSC
jgi:hypothetical protein